MLSYWIRCYRWESKQCLYDFYLTELLNVEDPENTNRHIDVELVNIYHEIDNINTLHNMIAAGEKYIRENLDTIINTE